MFNLLAFYSGCNWDNILHQCCQACPLISLYSLDGNQRYIHRRSRTGCTCQGICTHNKLEFCESSSHFS